VDAFPRCYITTISQKKVQNAFEIFTSNWIMRNMTWKFDRVEVVGLC